MNTFREEKIVVTNQPMYSDLSDENGRRRAFIFYKVVSYDERVFPTAQEVIMSE